MTAPFVLLGVPSFRGTPEREFIVALSETQNALAAAGVGYSMTMLAGDPYLAKVRNRIAAKFLTDFPHATHLFFIDDDVGWAPSKVPQLVMRGEDVVCGVYPKKLDQLEFPATLELDDAGQLIERDGLYQAHLAPTGFMCIARHVLERMAMNSPRYMETSATGEQLTQWSIFEARYVDNAMEALRGTDLDALSHEDAIAHLKRSLGLVTPSEMGQWWGEDFWFTERWRQMGGKIWVDPEIAFTHRGSKAWSATFGDSVRAVRAKMQEATHG